MPTANFRLLSSQTCDESALSRPSFVSSSSHLVWLRTSYHLLLSIILQPLLLQEVFRSCNLPCSFSRFITLFSTQLRLYSKYLIVNYRSSVFFLFLSTFCQSKKFAVHFFFGAASHGKNRRLRTIGIFKKFQNYCSSTCSN